LWREIDEEEGDKEKWKGNLVVAGLQVVSLPNLKKFAAEKD